jgi:tetratricopeptide (TPR) repeat protein
LNLLWRRLDSPATYSEDSTTLTYIQAEQMRVALAADADAMFDRYLGLKHKALDAERQALAIYRRRLPTDDPRTAATLDSIGLRLHNLGKDDEAEAALNEALTVQTAISGPDSQAVARILDDLRLLRSAAGQFEDATALDMLRIETLRRAAPESTDLAKALVEVAGRYGADGRLIEAEAFWREAIAINLRLEGGTADATIDAMRGLTKTLIGQARFAEAEVVAGSALASAREATSYPYYPEIIFQALDDLAAALVGQRRYDEALAHLDEHQRGVQEAFSLTSPEVQVKIATILYQAGRKALGDAEVAALLENLKDGFDDDYSASAFEGIATTYGAQGRYVEQEAALQEALRIRMQREDPLGGSITWLRHLVNENLKQQGRFAEAEAGLLELDRLFNGEFIQILSTLSSIRTREGRLAEAEIFARRALSAWRERSLGHPTMNLAAGLNNLGMVLQARGALREAELVHSEALAIVRANVGSRTVTAGRVLNNLATAIGAAGRYGEAEPLLREALHIQRALDGDSSPEMAVRLRNLAVVLAAQGRRTEAEPLFGQALDIRRTFLGPAHPDLGQSLGDLGILLAEIRRDGEAEPLLEEALRVNAAVWCPAAVQTLAPGFWNAGRSGCLAHNSLVENQAALGRFRLSHLSKPFAGVRGLVQAGDITLARTRQRYNEDPEARAMYARFVPVHADMISAAWGATHPSDLAAIKRSVEVSAAARP